MTIYREPTEADQGQSFLVKSLQLVHADFNPDGVTVGVVVIGDDGLEAICAEWNDHQDCFITAYIHPPFTIREIPV